MDPLKMMKIITLILFLASQAQAQDITGSGDGPDIETTTRDVSLIDENGDISTVATAMDNDSNTEAVDSNSTVLSDTTVEGTTVASTPMVTVIDDPVTKTDPPTTMTTTESTTVVTTPSTTMSTTTTTTTTTEAPTTSTTVTSTTEKSTTSFSTTTVSEKTKSTQSTAKVHPVPTVSTTFIPDDAGKYCTFLDSELKCDEEIYCFGEGEIDCTEDAELDSAETTFMEKISLSSVAGDYPDYDADGEAIGTFPPSLIGGKSQKKGLPHLLKMGSLETVMNAENSSETAKEGSTTTPTSASVVTTTSPVTEELLDGEVDEHKDASAALDAEAKEETTDPKVIEELTGTSTTLSTGDTVEEEMNKTHYLFKTHAENSTSDGESTTHGPVTTVEYVTSGSVTELPVEEASVTGSSSEEPVNVRRKREEIANLSESDSSSSSSSTSASFKVAALESSKKTMKVKLCRLSGNLVCSPSPSTSMCKGKTFCQAASGAAEKSEKSTTHKGVENWAIAVIVICAIAAGLTIALLIYLVFTSWKKLKVQPQNGVTTLNYVNNAQP